MRDVSTLPERPALGWDLLDVGNDLARHYRRQGATDHPLDDMRVHETDDGWLIGLPGRDDLPVVVCLDGLHAACKLAERLYCGAAVGSALPAFRRTAL